MGGRERVHFPYLHKEELPRPSPSLLLPWEVLDLLTRFGMKNKTCNSAPSFSSEPAAHRKSSGMLVCAIVFVVVRFCIFGALFKNFFLKFQF